MGASKYLLDTSGRYMLLSVDDEQASKRVYVTSLRAVMMVDAINVLVDDY
jgi:hypothetical protein